ncbi:hypothetical protein PI124_g2112 [Phytophthora idaei]|nr:hypothetical protein PI124_g2112 [Phytophthora idaei]
MDGLPVMIRKRDPPHNGSAWMPRRRRTLDEHHGDAEGSSHKQPLRLVARTNILHRCASQKHGFHM